MVPVLIHLVAVWSRQTGPFEHLYYLVILAIGVAWGMTAGTLVGISAALVVATIPGDQKTWLFLDYATLVTSYIAVGVLAGALSTRVRKEGERWRMADTNLHAVIENAPLVLWALDSSGRFTLSEGRGLAALGLKPGEVVGRSVFDVYADSPAIVAESRRAMSGQPVRTTVEAGGRVFDMAYNPLHDRAGELTGAIGVALDVTERSKAESEHTRLAAVVEQASETVLITDGDGVIRYVNPAWERYTGYRGPTVIGSRLISLPGAAAYARIYGSMARAIAAGGRWAGILPFRCLDGATRRSDTVVAPILEADGTFTSVVAVGRDVTTEEFLTSRLQHELENRADVAHKLATLKPHGTLEETAAAICAEAAAIEGFDFVGITRFVAGGLVVPLAISVPVAAPLAVGHPIPRARARELRERATIGPWIEEFSAEQPDRYDGRMTRAGLRGSIYVPIHGPTRPVGVFCFGTTNPELAATLADHMPTAQEFAAVAGALLGASTEREQADDVARSRLERIILERLYKAFFQPIIDLTSGVTVGFEALTRFDDGVGPAERFAKAAALGLGAEFEIGCLCRAIEATANLPAGAWVSFNLSPERVADPHLAALLSGIDREVVIEVTEHSEVKDYVALRLAAHRLGPRVSLAVDDAGAGYASLRHILELRPQLVKLDIALVRSIDSDAGRQALVAGVQHFASASGITVIAEGVETTGEADTLRRLGVPLAQGFLFGAPALPRLRALAAGSGKRLRQQAKVRPAGLLIAQTGVPGVKRPRCRIGGRPRHPGRA